MSVQEFEKMISHVQGEEDLEGRLQVYEAFVRYIAKGGVNTFHTWKIAKMIRDSFAIANKT